MITKERAWIELDFNALKENIELLQRLLPTSCQLMAVVKANAYGHGAILISKELNRLGIFHFAVATLKEAICLREQGIIGEILILGYTDPSDIKDLIFYDFTQTILDKDYASWLNFCTKNYVSSIHYKQPCCNLSSFDNSSSSKVKVHLKIDTGMHRLGEDYQHSDFINEIFSYPYLNILGTYSHLCVADHLTAHDINFTQEQISHFYETIQNIKLANHNPGKIHIQSSYGILHYSNLICDFARPGIALYGAFSNLEDRQTSSVPLRPVLSLKAQIASIKEVPYGETVGYGRTYTATSNRKIATVTIGYADGLPRNFSEHNSFVLINGHKAFVVGRICMDQLMVDVTDIPSITTSQIVTLIGKDGDLQIFPEEVADKCCTITNELLSRLGDRPSRIVVS